MLTFTEINKPLIDIELFGTDTHIPPIDKVRVMDEDSFEHFTLEWLYLAAITQLIGVILAKSIHELKLFKSIRKLVKKAA